MPVSLAGPGLVVGGGPECGSVELGRGIYAVWALTAPEHGTSDTCSLIAWTIDLLSNILWEGHLLQNPKQLKIINHKFNKAMHSTALSESASLPPSRAIGNILFPTYEVMTSSLHSNDVFFYWKNNVTIHWLITIHIYIYMQNICAVFCVKCEEWQVGCHRHFFLAEYTGVIFTLTSHNVTWFYYRNFDYS